MKATQGNLSVSVLTLAVRGALTAMAVMPLAAMAANSAADVGQMTPTNTVEIGANMTSQSSAKYGEYNGLDQKGVLFNGGLSLQGGNAYGEGSGTMRWSVTGTNLGTDSKNIGASVTDQGKWTLGVDYDQLRHELSDNFETPYNGEMGGNSFVLPSSFGVVTDATNLTPSQLAMYHKENVANKRDTTSFNAGMNVNRQWSVDFHYKHIDMSGAKIMAMPTQALDSADAASGGYSWEGEHNVYLMNPNKFKIDNFTLALNWKGDKGFASLGYYGSLFHDEYSHVSISDPYVGDSVANGTIAGVAYPTSYLQTNPSNQFHQLNLTGGYNLTPRTRLVGGLSYARNTQDESFANTYQTNSNMGGYATGGQGTTMPGSADARVILKHADLHLTQQINSALDLNAGITYNERDNHTSSHEYYFHTITNEDDAMPVNVPYSWRHTQAKVGVNYQVAKGQHIHASYKNDQFKRWCDTPTSMLNDAQSWAAANGHGPDDGSTAAARTGCAQVPKNTTDTFDLNYRGSLNEMVNMNAGYEYSKRKADVSTTYYSPLQSFEEGWENMGFLAFFQAGKKTNAFKVGTNIQASANLNIDARAKYAKDDYSGGVFGWKNGDSQLFNVDATYSMSPVESVDAYITSQRRTRDFDNGNGRLAGSIATTSYTNHLNDHQTMVGVGAHQKSLMGGRLELSETIAYSLGKESFDTEPGIGNYSCSNTRRHPEAGNTYGCGTTTVKTQTTDVKLAGAYSLNKASKVVLSYEYAHMNNDDPVYYSMLALKSPNPYGSGGRLPDNQQSPNYSVSEVFLGYQYSFK